MKMDLGDKTLAVGICTYKRPEGLAKSLDYLERQTIWPQVRFSVVVVNNDGTDPAVAKVVDDFSTRSGIAATYLIEREPGISAARNAVFDEIDRQGISLVAMLDDDEFPAPVWLEALVLKHLETGAAVVGGPVAPVFPEAFAHMYKYQSFWSVNKMNLNGKVFVFCTCNFLLDMSRLSAMARPLFDEAFGISGGGDTVFFRRLFFAGLDMAWSEEAQVMEDVPPSRSTLDWMKTRIYRKGNHSVHWERVGGSPATSWLKTIALTGRLLVYPVKLLKDPHPMVSWMLEYQRIRGRYNAHFGSLYMEYARPPEQQTGKAQTAKPAAIGSEPAALQQDGCRDRSHFPAKQADGTGDQK